MVVSGCWDCENFRFLQVVAYRRFTHFVHGGLQEKRIPLPACAYTYHAIQTAFMEKGDDFTGYEDLENENCFGILCIFHAILMYWKYTFTNKLMFTICLELFILFILYIV